MSLRRIILFTNVFPFEDSSENAFLMPELDALLDTYDITIVACRTKKEEPTGEFLEKYGDRIRAYSFPMPGGNYIEEALLFFRALGDPVFRKELHLAARTGGGGLKKILWVFLNYYWAENVTKRMKERLPDIEDTDGVLYYTFWNEFYLLALALMKRRYPDMKLVSRIHGYDLFEDQSPYGYQPFKRFMDEMTDRTIFISEQGKAYFERQYHTGENGAKHIVCRLGVLPQPEAHNEDEQGEKHGEFLLVSCSNLFPLKNIPTIIHALGELKELPIRWVHFGKGEEEESLKGLADEILTPLENIRFEFAGFRKNEEILAFYRENRPDCFITTSLTEGSPVSMQEAIACGIPVIGTSVGGIPEMIDKNGVLLSGNPSVKETADAIRRIAEATPEEVSAMRKRSLEIWAEKFDRSKNNQRFLKILKEL